MGPHCRSSHFHPSVRRCSGLEVVDLAQCAAEAAAEDHADELDEGDAAGHGHQVDEVLLRKVDQGVGTSLKYETMNIGDGTSWLQDDTVYIYRVHQNCVSKVSVSFTSTPLFAKLRKPGGRGATGMYRIHINHARNLLKDFVSYSHPAKSRQRSKSPYPAFADLQLIKLDPMHLQGGPFCRGQPFVDLKLGVEFSTRSTVTEI